MAMTAQGNINNRIAIHRIRKGCERAPAAGEPAHCQAVQPVIQYILNV
ncbi:MAG: Uncharacterised protein [Hyphomonas sp. TMED17]|nr:MAG: Uncharacterised protein [Hyphomonas sp. TMED17]